MKQKLVILSLDAMVTEDLDYAAQFPAFRELMDRGALVRHLRSIYPSLTYPCHVAMISGCYPERSGVISNYPQDPGGPHVFSFYHDIVRCEDLMDAAHRAGYTTASVSWPVTGNHKSVDYLVDEIWANTDDIEDFHQAYLGSGTPEWLYQELVAQWVPLRMKRGQPGTGWFSTHVAAGIIRKYAPDIIAIHIAPIDTFRHIAGVFSDMAREGVACCAEMLQELLDAVKATGNYDNTDFIVTSDHGQLDYDRVAAPNLLLQEAGLLTNADGSYRAFCFSAGNSVHVRVYDPADLPAVHALFLANLKKDRGYSAVYTAEEALKEHLAGSLDLVLETDGHTTFSEATDGEYFTAKKGGQHGHHPDKGPGPFLLACGPDFRPGALLEHAVLVDPPVTYAKLLGLSLPDAQGRVLTELLKN